MGEPNLVNELQISATASNSMNPKKAKELLARQRSLVSGLRSQSRSAPEFESWLRNTRVALEQIFGRESSQVTEFVNIRFTPFAVVSGAHYLHADAYRGGLEKASAVLESMTQEITEFGFTSQTSPREVDHVEMIKTICRRFHIVARQLRRRYAERPPFEITDEYDVQDLLHALLRLHFDDVRAEDPAPKQAGASSRIDFVFKEKGILLEVKKTRTGLGDKEIGNQLIVDIERYRTHPEYKTLIFFVYDPEGILHNAAGLQNDLTCEREGVEVIVVIAPQ